MISPQPYESDPVVDDSAMIGNDRLRVTFRRGQPRHGHFPAGWVGFDVETKQPDGWRTVARAPFLTAWSYRSPGWGRDWLHYVVGQEAAIDRVPGGERFVVTATRHDIDAVSWRFTVSVTVRDDAPIIDVRTEASVDATRDLLLLWGPRLHVGDGTEKDEAFFAGVEWLDATERSSALTALAPDARWQVAPDARYVTLPLMSVTTGGVTVGLAWDPAHGDGTPVPVFASPNFVENEDNHLLGLFVPGGPAHHTPNALRADRPQRLEAGSGVAVEGRIFVVEGGTPALLDAWLGERGGVPPVVRGPSDDTGLELVVDALLARIDAGTTTEWPEGVDPNWGVPATLLTMRRAGAVVGDALGRRAVEASDEGLAKVREARVNADAQPLAVALRTGSLSGAVEALHRRGLSTAAAQSDDGSWTFTPSPVAELGLSQLMGPPATPLLWRDDSRAQGITAEALGVVLYALLVTGDASLRPAVERGLADLAQYRIPTLMGQDECPLSPSLHGANLAARACLLAYRIDGDPAQLAEAVRWAKLGLPFIYLWSTGPREVTSAHVAMRTYLAAEDVYGDTHRDPMLYGALYGYGSSQFIHHWYGLLVQWIGLEFAQTLADLAEHDRSVDWPTVADGLVASALSQTYDVGGYAGSWPDAFNLLTWVPSGPAIGPSPLLESLMAVRHGWRAVRTELVTWKGRVVHVTAGALDGRPVATDDELRVAVTSGGGDEEVQLVLAGLGVGLDLAVSVDGTPAPLLADVDEAATGWARGAAETVLVRAPVGDSGRVVVTIRRT